MNPITESTAEDAALEWLESLGYSIAHGPDIAPAPLPVAAAEAAPSQRGFTVAIDGPAERSSYEEVVLPGRLKSALAKLNPKIPADALDDAFRKVLRSEHPSLLQNNEQFHKYLIESVPVDYQGDGRTVSDHARLIDFDDAEANDWLVVNQFTVIENQHNRRPDVVIFVNGLPLAVFELKNPAKEQTSVREAFKQFETYKEEIPSLFQFAGPLIISDGLAARAGTVSSDWERFMPWRTVDGRELAPSSRPQLEVLIKGMFEKKRFLDLIRYFTVFEHGEKTTIKKMTSYHQFHAVQKAIEATVKAVKGDRRAGVVWHTQGSGKSLTMVFYAGKIIQHPEMKNPTLVLLTDRNDLDDQLFDRTFVPCSDLLAQAPIQSTSRVHLRELLKRASGGVIFTTIQKFLPDQKGDLQRMSSSLQVPSKRNSERDTNPLLSDRRNIVVIADEAHRSQYDFIKGLAKHMRDCLPQASFIGFTATPIEAGDRNTRAVFGDYIDIYDIHQSIEDKATVPIYYEARLAKLGLKPEEMPKIDPQFEEVTEGEEENVQRKLKTKWARMEALVGAERRIRLIAKDIVEHFEKRREAMEGKGLIVCMSRRICVDLYNEIVKLRPLWHDPDDKKGFLKVVMTGSAADGPEWQAHIRDKERRKRLGDEFKKPECPIRLVIVRDMWLTGFDVPSLHTMYIDKPMRGHGLMQAIARVNRVFKDKPGGLVVDYLGIAHELKAALAEYSERDRKAAGIDQEIAVAKLLEKLEVLRGIFAGPTGSQPVAGKPLRPHPPAAKGSGGWKYDYGKFFKGTAGERVAAVSGGMDYILQQVEDGKKRFLQAVAEMSQAFALSVPHDKALAVRNEVSYFQAIKASLIKNTEAGGADPADLDNAIRQIVSGAVYSDKVVDIFAASGQGKPDISILSDKFLDEVRRMPQKNLAAEALRKLLEDEIKIRERKFLVKSRSFAKMLEETIQRYHNRAIEAAQVIEELIKLAREMREAHKRGEKLGLTEDELAFYDALETSDSAVKILGDKVLGAIARDLVKSVRQNLAVDWSLKESVRARMRVTIKRLLREHGYPPDKQERATETVLKQTELLCRNWPEEDLVSAGVDTDIISTGPVEDLPMAADGE